MINKNYKKIILIHLNHLQLVKSVPNINYLRKIVLNNIFLKKTLFYIVSILTIKQW